jgi:N-glycosidase YbiA
MVIVMVKIIDSFSGDYRFLSNFHPSRVTFKGMEYRTVEHAYQAAKTNDISLRKKIANAATPGMAKYIGRKLFLRDDWDAVKLSIMNDLVRQKFTAHPCLAAQLLATGDDALIEGNWWGDIYWGVCRGRGENHLGKILMAVRAELNQIRILRRYVNTRRRKCRA